MSDQDIDLVESLCQAAASGDAETVRFLLSLGVPPEDGSDWHNALIRAANNGQAECASALIAAGANPNTSDSYGRSALWHAAGEKSGKLSNYCSMPAPTRM
jgi:ankyrin repeat protein